MKNDADTSQTIQAEDAWDEPRRQRLARVVTKLFEYWQLPIPTQAQVLGFSTEAIGEMELLRDGGALPDRPDVRERIGCLLGIHRALKILYPANPEIVRGWVSTPMSMFRDMAPIDVMVSDDLSGISAVHQYLIDQLEI